MGVNEVPVEVPIWDHAHRTLNDMRESLFKAREDVAMRGRRAEEEIRQIDEALSRIAPPQPMPAVAVSGGSGFASLADMPNMPPSSTPHNQRKVW